MSKLFVANWKMHGHAGLAKKLLSVAASLDDIENVAVMVPYPYLYLAQQELANTAAIWGAQTLSMYSQGAFTGEVCAEMLSEFGCKMVLVGHSERRSGWGELDDLIANQALVASSNGIKPIICVGEDLACREKGVHFQYVKSQIETVSKFLIENKAKGEFVFAYEPIWAIGSGRAANADEVEKMHLFIRECLLQISIEFSSRCIIIYGGSVNKSNLESLLTKQDVGGVLVGGASLKVNEFIDMVNICKA